LPYRATMIRGLGLRGAIAVDMITMIGIGPLVTIPLVLSALHGGAALAAWIVGALIAICDGLVWAELGARLPGSGGTYRYLREAFGRNGAGRMLSFLFVWQFVISAPLLLASGYIGFAQYAGYLWPALGASSLLQGLLAASVGLVTIALLYRDIVRVAAIATGLWIVALATLAAVTIAGLQHFAAANLAVPHDATTTGGAFPGAAALAGLGVALVITLYDYAGYGEVCFVADEVVAPARTIPRAIVWAILLTAAFYLALQVAVLGAVPWQRLVATAPGGAPPDAALFVASTVVEHAWGAWPARGVTALILVVAFASTFGNLLGMSRIPYAAALDGAFFAPFARLHPTGRFPAVALVTIGLIALPAAFLPLGAVIGALTAGLVLAQSLAQIAAVVLLRRRHGASPYRMWLYPLPAIVAALGWTFIFASSGNASMLFGAITLAAGCAIYLLRARRSLEWPYLVARRGA